MSSKFQDMRERVLDADPKARALHNIQEERMRLVRAVIAARTAREWSQRDLARAAGLQQPAVARFERGDTDPRFGTIARICGALDLPVTVGTTAIVA
jgi:HTH-type transcriptional regulator/antitoxin HipB